MNRRRVVTVGMFVAPLVVAAVACSFPDVTFDTSLPDSALPLAEAASGEDTSTGADSATGTGAPSGDGGTIAVLSDADAGAAVEREDGQAAVDANICNTRTPCDCDEDGYGDIECHVDASTLPAKDGGSLKVGDCDDTDPLRHPGQGFVDEVPKGHNGDWNCDDLLESNTPSGTTWCTGNPVVGAGCTKGVGYQQSGVACGAEAPLSDCVPSGLSCVMKAHDPPDPTPRPCR